MGFRITRMCIVGAAALAAGCASRGQLDVLESRLRQQDDQITQLQNQLTTTQSQLQASHRESDELRTQVADGTRTARVEQVSALGTVEGIELNRYLTGGLDRDGQPGDEALSAVVVPTDSQGNLVKAPGSVSITLFDLSKPEAQQRIGYWEYSSKQSETLWHSGFLGSGYIIRQPWQQKPQSANLLVHARLKTIDGRQFDTSQTIHVVPPGQTDAPPASVAATTPQAPPSQLPSMPPASPIPTSTPAPVAPPVSSPPGQPVAQKSGATTAGWWDEPAKDTAAKPQ
jgi:outer membrane murein-binding lipoprotein Lpp